MSEDKYMNVIFPKDNVDVTFHVNEENHGYFRVQSLINPRDNHIYYYYFNETGDLVADSPVAKNLSIKSFIADWKTTDRFFNKIMPYLHKN